MFGRSPFESFERISRQFDAMEREFFGDSFFAGFPFEERPRLLPAEPSRPELKEHKGDDDDDDATTAAAKPASKAVVPTTDKDKEVEEEDRQVGFFGLRRPLFGRDFMDVETTDDAYNVSLAHQHGMPDSDVRVKVEKTKDGRSMLNVSDRHEQRWGDDGDDKDGGSRGYSYSSFSRSVSLPDDVEADAMETSHDEATNRLRIKLPRKAKM